MNLNFSEWKPIDYIVGFIVLVVGIFLLLVIIGVAVTGNPLNDFKAKLVSSIVTSLISIISVYVGNRLSKSKDS